MRKRGTEREWKKERERERKREREREREREGEIGWRERQTDKKYLEAKKTYKEWGSLNGLLKELSK